MPFNIELAVACLSVTAIAMMRSYVRYGLYPMPTGFIAFALLSQVSLLLVVSGTISYHYLRIFFRGGIYDHFNDTMLLYTLCSALAHFSMVGLSRHHPRTGLSFMSRISSPTYRVGGVLMSLVVAAQFASLDFSHIYQHSVYLSVLLNESTVSIIGRPVADTLVRAIPFTAILISAWTAGLPTRLVWSRLAGLALCLLLFVYLLSANSRAAAFLPIVFGLVYALRGGKGRGVVGALCAGLAAYSLVNALVGRGLPVQGIVGLPITFGELVGDRGGDALLGLLTNVCEGIFVVAEGWELSPDFSAAYSWLSLSPLPSALDGFSDIQTYSQVRLHEYVPMAAITELMNFGPAHVTVFSLYILALSRIQVYISSRNYAISLLLNFVIFFTCYLIFSYPTRNALRYCWIAYYVVAIYYARQIMMDRRRERANPPHPNAERRNGFAPPTLPPNHVDGLP